MSWGNKTDRANNRKLFKKAITCIPLSASRGQLPLARHTNDSNFNEFDATLTELSVH